jgi:hypothetical protein
MDYDWAFQRVSDARKGTGWQWQRRSPDGGEVIENSNDVFAFYAECMNDAMRHGYIAEMNAPR